MTEEVLPELDRCANVVRCEARSALEAEFRVWRLSPYEVTFKTDADMLFSRGNSLYHPRHVSATTGVACSERGVPSHSVQYRVSESALGFPTIYSALFSFDNSGESQFFYEQCERILRQWHAMRMWKLRPDLKIKPTTDSIYSFAWATVWGQPVSGNHFVHAKPGICQWDHREDTWSAHRSLKYDEAGCLYLGPVRQRTPFHYYDKSIITSEFVEQVCHVCDLQEGRQDNRQRTS
jgi:hypothetical protein